jgi:hypothetical protein
MKKLFCIFLIIITSGCGINDDARPLQQFTKEEKDRRFSKFLSCLQMKAKEVDDKVSDAYTIANAVASLCFIEGDSASELYATELNQNAKNLYMEKVRKEYVKRALVTVLQERNRKK